MTKNGDQHSTAAAGSQVIRDAAPPPANQLRRSGGGVANSTVKFKSGTRASKQLRIAQDYSPRRKRWAKNGTDSAAERSG